MRLVQWGLILAAIAGCKPENEILLEDRDNDGFSAGEDCFDEDPETYPGAEELCDGKDNDCDGEAEPSSEYFADEDGDGFGDADNATISCDGKPDGYVGDDDDCDDGDDQINPDASEICNDADDDCDGAIDEDATGVTWYQDRDEDGFGDPDETREACDQPEGYVRNDRDCDDFDEYVNPDADETCNGVDDDCDGVRDDDPVDGTLGYPDDDGDGFGASGAVMACDGVDNDFDCNDFDDSEPVVVDAVSGTSAGAGTVASPLRSLQAGIDRAYECVVAMGGTYYEDIDFGGKNLSVIGAEGPDVTVIDGTGAGATVTFENGESSTAVLDGFTITGGTGDVESTTSSYSCGSSTTCTDHYDVYCGGGIAVDGADPTLRNLVVDGNSLPVASTSTSGNDTYYVYSYGGGVCLRSSAATLTGVDIQENYADQGGALYVDVYSNAELSESFLVANSATDGGSVMVEGGSLTLENVASSWNEATGDGGGTFVIDGSLTATNVTYGSDDAANGAGIYLSGTSTGTVMNTILYGAATGEGVLVDSTAFFSGSYNDVFANAGGAYSGVSDPTGTGGNVSVNPTFASVTADGNPWNDNWTLRPASALVNAGNPGAAYNDADGTRNDIGAFGGPGSEW
jgi:hypothetical protein